MNKVLYMFFTVNVKSCGEGSSFQFSQLLTGGHRCDIVLHIKLMTSDIPVSSCLQKTDTSKGQDLVGIVCHVPIFSLHSALFCNIARANYFHY